VGLETVIGSPLEETGRVAGAVFVSGFARVMFADLKFIADLRDLMDLVDLDRFVFMLETPACELPAGFYHRADREKQAGGVFCRWSIPGRRFGRRVSEREM